MRSPRKADSKKTSTAIKYGLLWRKAGDRNSESKEAHEHHARLQGRNDACAAFEILEQLFGARFAGLRIFFDAGFVSRFRSGFAHGEKRAKHEKEQKQQQGEGEG